MGAVDCIDQRNTAAGGFASEYLGKNWFVQVFLSILDTMVNNGQVAWNTFTEDLSWLQREIVTMYLFQAVSAEKTENFRKEENILLNHTEHYQPKCTYQKYLMKIAQNGLIATYASWRHHLEMHVVWDIRSARCKNRLVKCDMCGIIAHGIVSDLDRKILSFLEFIGISCFNIAHMKECVGLFHTLEFSNTNTQKRRISRHSSHPILHRLRGDWHKEDDESPM